MAQVNQVARLLPLSLLLVCAQVVAEPLRILCIGDSITQGGRQDRREYTYRLPLQKLLRPIGVPVDFVGSRVSGVDAAARWPAGFDPQHEGYYGATSAEVRDHLRTSLARFSPADIVLVHLGTNDYPHHEDFVEPLHQIIDMLRARNPDVVVLVGQLASHGWWARYERWRVRGLVAQLSTPQSPVLAVNHYEGWNDQPGSPDADTYDWAHPNDRGQRRMAVTWFNAMLPFIVVHARQHALRIPPGTGEIIDG